jgi:hypothetical protein
MPNRVSPPRMTDHEWQQLLPLMRRIRPERLKAAYNRLVKGESLEAAGEIAGMTRHGVHDLVAGILVKQSRLHESRHAAEAGIPKGWIRLTVDVPATAVAELQQFVTALAHKQNGRSRAGNKGKPRTAQAPR